MSTIKEIIRDNEDNLGEIVITNQAAANTTIEDIIMVAYLIVEYGYQFEIEFAEIVYKSDSHYELCLPYIDHNTDEYILLFRITSKSINPKNNFIKIEGMPNYRPSAEFIQNVKNALFEYSANVDVTSYVLDGLDANEENKDNMEQYYRSYLANNTKSARNV